MKEHTYIGNLYSDDMQRTLAGQLSIWRDIEDEPDFSEEEKAERLKSCLDEITFLLDLDMTEPAEIQQALTLITTDTLRRSELVRLLKERAA